MSSKIRKKERGVARMKGQSKEIRIERSISYQPLPTPEELREYEKVVPGFADRVLKHIETQQLHHKEIVEHAIQRDMMELENEAMGIRAAKIISFFLLLLSFAVLGAGVYMGSKLIIGLSVAITLFITVIVVVLATIRNNE